MSKKTSKEPKAVSKAPESYTMSRFLKDIVEVVVPAIILFLVIKTFFFESRFVPSPSMVPTIQVHDRFLLNKTAYWFKTPERYQIVIFKPPARAGAKEDFVKRIIGLPGETIKVHKGVVYINDKPLSESYITPDRAPIGEYNALIIPDDHVFVMGDNRNNSQDSRYWGSLPIENIKGEAWWRFWPVNRVGIIK